MAWDVILEKQIQRELSQLDSDLFLDKEYFEGSVYPIVRYRVGETIYNVATYPYLSLEIVSIVRMQEGDIMEAISHAKANNLAKKELARQETVKALEEAADEHDRSTGKLRRWYIPGVKPL